METIGNSDLVTFLSSKKEITPKTSNRTVREDDGSLVSGFQELAARVAQIHFSNPKYVLLFRGQNTDYRDDSGMTTILPTIFRGMKKKDREYNKKEMSFRIAELRKAQKYLVDKMKAGSIEETKKIALRRTLTQWAMIQHYEVCETPLLDLTQSLRVAASFSSAEESEMAFVYVLGVPSIAGGVTVNAEEELQTIRLSSVCPPEALRAHLQEGYHLCAYPEIREYDDLKGRRPLEFDCARRLLAKFRFNPRTFWGASKAFPRIGEEALRPDRTTDAFLALAENIKSDLELPF